MTPGKRRDREIKGGKDENAVCKLPLIAEAVGLHPTSGKASSKLSRIGVPMH